MLTDHPPLDGTLHLDRETRQEDAADNGRYVERLPAAVLRPGSVDDIQRMVAFCRKTGISVATRGQAHSTHGQGLTSGLVIESRARATIHAIDKAQRTADVDAGVTWLELTRAAYKEGLTPPVLTGYLDLSVGGTLSMGGISSTPRVGLQIDHVRELEVVTGTGRVERCSPTHNEDLFDAVLGGLGGFGVITRATIELVPAHERVRTYAIAYPDNATFFADLRELLHRDELEELWGQWIPTEQGLAYHLMAAQPFDPATPPDDDSLLRGLGVPRDKVTIADVPYETFAERVDTYVAGLRETIGWDDLVKPWFDVWLPGTNVEAYVGDVIPTLTHRDVGPGGWVLLFPLHRPALTRTMARMPEPDGDEFVYLFDILTSSERPGPDEAFAKEMVRRNDRLFERAVRRGGVRYPIGSVDFSQAEWVAHYGDQWPDIVRRKRQYDPERILTPGFGIWG